MDALGPLGYTRAVHRRTLLRGSLAALAGAAIGAPLGCNRRNASQAPLTLGLSDWPGHAPFYGAKKLGLFGETNIEIKGFSSNFDRNRAFAQGRLDALATPLFDTIRIADMGAACKLVLLFDYSSGGDGIVARGGITKVAELKGKRVSAELGAITHFVLLAALETAGLRESDVEIKNLSVPEGAEAFEQGKVDAATLWDPHLGRLAKLEGARKIFTSKEIPGQIIDVLIVQRAIAEARPDDVENLLRGWQKSLEAWRKSAPDHEVVMASEMPGRTPASLKVDLEGLELLDLDTNAKLYEESGAGPSSRKSFDATVAFMQQNKLLKAAPPAASEILDRRFVDRARKAR